MVHQLLHTAPAAADGRQLDEVCRTLLRSRCSFSTEVRGQLLEYALAVVIEDQVSESVRDRARDILLVIQNSSFPPSFSDTNVPHDVAAAVAVLNAVGPCFIPGGGASRREQLQQAVQAVLLLQEQDRSALQGTNRWAQFESWLVAQAEQMPTASAQGHDPPGHRGPSASFHNDLQLLCTLRCALELRYPVVKGELPPAQFADVALATCLEVLGRQVSSHDLGASKQSGSRGGRAAETDIHTATCALSLLSMLLMWRPDYATQALSYASTLLRGTLPLGGGLLTLQATAVHLIMQALEVMEQTVEYAAHKVVQGHEELRDDLQDLMSVSVSCRWTDYMGMLQLLDVIDWHQATLIRHHPGIMPHFAPLLLKAASWAPHVLGRHILAVLPIMTSPTTVTSLVPYVLDLPCLPLGAAAVLSKETQNSDVYSTVKWTPPITPVKKSVRSAFGGLSPLSSYFSTSASSPSTNSSTPLSPYRMSRSDARTDVGTAASLLGPAPDVLSNLMDRDFTGGATLESDYRAEQSGALQSYLEDLGYRDTFEEPLSGPWRTTAVPTGLAKLSLQLRSGSDAAPGPLSRIRYVCAKLGPSAMALVLKLVVHHAADEVLQVLVQYMLTRRCRVFPWASFQDAAGQLQRGFLAAAVHRQPQLLQLLRSKFLRLTLPDDDPLLGDHRGSALHAQGVDVPSPADAAVLANAYALEDLRLASAALELLGLEVASGQAAVLNAAARTAEALLLPGTSPCHSPATTTDAPHDDAAMMLFNELHAQACQRMGALAEAWFTSCVSNTIHTKYTSSQSELQTPAVRARSTTTPAATSLLGRSLSRPGTPPDNPSTPLTATPSMPLTSPPKNKHRPPKPPGPRPLTPPLRKPTPAMDIPLSQASSGLLQQSQHGTAGSSLSTVSKHSGSLSRTSGSFSFLGALRNPLETFTDAFTSIGDKGTSEGAGGGAAQLFLSSPEERCKLAVQLLCTLLSVLVQLVHRNYAALPAVRQLLRDTQAAAIAATDVTPQHGLPQVLKEAAVMLQAQSAALLHDLSMSTSVVH